MASFVHLKARSTYSLLQCSISPAALVETAVADGQAALALADENNLFAALEFATLAAEAGVQPINGLQILVAAPGEGRTPDSLTLLATNEAGLSNLVALSTDLLCHRLAHEHSAPGDRPSVPLAKVAAYAEGLIGLICAPSSRLYSLIRSGRMDQARSKIGAFGDLFPDRLYVELQRNTETDRGCEGPLLELAREARLPVVATQEPLVLDDNDLESLEALYALQDGLTLNDERRRTVAASSRMQSSADMVARFSDLPQTLDNTLLVAQRCHASFRTRTWSLPRFREGDVAEEEKELDRRTEEGLQARLEGYDLPETYRREDYESQRLRELKVIAAMRYAGYFLVVADFVNWAKSQNIPVGPGRGSGAASVVAWAMGITDVDPLRFGLVFERFLNPDRVSLPDFDIDFCPLRRDDVVRYVQQRYGEDRVAHINTFGSLQTRAALRDMGRVLGLSFPEVDRLAKLVPREPGSGGNKRMSDHLKEVPQLQRLAEEDPRTARLFGLAAKVEGLPRHASTHAAGIVIGDGPLRASVPLYRDPKSFMPVTQYTMEWIDKAGLVKFDFLGLKTLSVIAEALRLLEPSGVRIDFEAVGWDDDDTFALLRTGNVLGVFQLESPGMRRTLMELQPTVFSEIIALISLYRPGPMQQIPLFCDRKNGKVPVEYLHPTLEPVLKETYGVIVYQEQVLQIARILAGYDMKSADLLRRAMGKKIPSQMKAHQKDFVQGAQKQGIQKATAQHLFTQIAKFAEYGFAKAHSVPYAMLCFQTAYLKAHHPLAFVAASMTFDSQNFKKLRQFVSDLRRMGFALAAPSVASSRAYFDVQDGKIAFSLAAVRGVGEGAAKHIVDARERAGGFAGIDDWIRHIDPKIINKRALEGLIFSGAFDVFGISRETLYANLDALSQAMTRRREEAASGQVSLLDHLDDQELSDAASSTATTSWRAREAWSEHDRLAREYEACGLYLTGHPLDRFSVGLKIANLPSYHEALSQVGPERRRCRLAATLIETRRKRTKSNETYASVTFSDKSSQYEAIVFSSVYSAVSGHLVKKANVLIDCEFSNSEGADLRVLDVKPLSDALKRCCFSGLAVLEFSIEPSESAVHEIYSCLKAATGLGRTRVRIKMPGSRRAKRVLIELPGQYTLDSEAYRRLAKIDGLAIVLEPDLPAETTSSQPQGPDQLAIALEPDSPPETTSSQPQGPDQLAIALEPDSPAETTSSQPQDPDELAPSSAPLGRLA